MYKMLFGKVCKNDQSFLHDFICNNPEWNSITFNAQEALKKLLAFYEGYRRGSEGFFYSVFPSRLIF